MSRRGGKQLTSEAHPPVLVIGSYPPIATAAAPATVQAVRDVWSRGLDAIVVSPRLSAAHLTASVDGLSAGVRLSALRRSTGASEVVLSVEAGFPVHLASGPGPLVPLARWLTAVGLARSLRSFERVTLVESGPGDAYGPGWRHVRAQADQVRHYPDTVGRPGATPLGAREVDIRHQGRQLAALVGRRVLGSRYHAARVRAARLRRLASGMRRT